MISKYLIFVCFPKAHEFKFTRIKDHTFVIETTVYLQTFNLLSSLFSNILELCGNISLRRYVTGEYTEEELTKN